MASAIRRFVPLALRMRNIHTTTAVAAARQMTDFEKFGFEQCGYRKYGLLKDDMLRDFDPIVEEALSRIPEDMLMQRIYRSIRASQLYLEHNVLPEDQWTKPEDDHNYLQPYIEEIEAEILERQLWDRNH